MPIPPADRRPIASRDTRWAHALAGALAARGVSPNAVSLAGLAAGLGAGVALAATGACAGWERRACWGAAAALIQLRLLANLLDGMVAVAAGRRSRVGELYNDLPDRFSDAATLIGLGYAAGGVPELGYAAAGVALLTAYVRVLAKSVGVPGLFAGPMAKPHRMAVATACAVAGGVLPEGWGDRYHLAGWALGVCAIGGAVTVARRVWLAADRLGDPPP
ncbi:MAG: hypothetical protein JWO38_4004 [Gemmataceae bacterium]|nr:hypothetical protein [Gemmataceae bacterium]